MKARTPSPINEDRRESAEREIRIKQHEVRYDQKDYTIEFLVKQFQEGQFYIPDYQRNYIWRTSHKCRFIESVILGLPIPMLFVADMDDGRLEVVDGAQRIRTLEEFMNSDLALSNLMALKSLNGFRYSDLPQPQQRKFGTKSLRIVVLEDSTTSAFRQEVFDRVNTSGMKARASEIRRGSLRGKFMEFVTSKANDQLFRKLCPLSAQSVARREDEELVLRFFAFSDRYLDFRHDVDKFLDAYVLDNREKFDQKRMEKEFAVTMRFVNEYFPNGFKKKPLSASTPRVRFEAISVGVNLALREDPSLVPVGVAAWLESDDFSKQTTTHASNSGPRVRGRIEFVRDRLLQGG